MTTINTGSKLLGLASEETKRLRALLGNRDLPKVSVEVVTEVDPMWILLLCHYPDLFRSTCCGSWLYAVEKHPERGRLVWAPKDRSAGEGSRPSDEAEQAALTAWAAGEPLPADFHRFDIEAATNAWILGVAAGGASWFDDGDEEVYNAVLQKLLGRTG